MDHDSELLSVVKELAALQAIVVRLGDVMDRLEQDSSQLKQRGVQTETQVAHLDRDRSRLFQLVREAETEIKDIQHWLARVRQKLGLGEGEIVMGDKVEVHGSDLKGSQVGTGGQSQGDPPPWLKYIIWAAVLLSALALAGAMGLRISTDWFTVQPHTEEEH